MNIGKSSYRLIIVFRLHEVGSSRYADSIEKQNTPGDGAQDPAAVEFPADKEAIVVVVQKGLSQSQLTAQTHSRSKHVPQQP